MALRLSERAQLLALLAGAAFLFTWRLSVSGYANAYYSAAALAGSQSWRAMFFGSLDAGNAITVDKPPLALWPMVISVRLFGMSSWSLLLPQAIEGVASVALLYACVRRATGSPRPALLAGAAFALTPVSVLVFRYNNPDAMLTLVLLGAAAATLRALESRRATCWLVAAGALCGLGFLAKMLEALMVVPPLALTYVIFRRAPLRRRLYDLAAAGAAIVLSAGWWVATVELWPASSRPFIGGSPANSVLDLALGYNGMERITGGATATSSPSGGLGATNIARIGRTDIGGEVLWFLPAAVLLGVLAWTLSRRLVHRSDVHAVILLWASWLLVSIITFALMAGIFHSYYTVVLAPGIAALTGVGGWVAWEHRYDPRVRRSAASAMLATTLLAVTILLAVGAHLRWTAVPVGAAGLTAVLVLWPRTGPARLSLAAAGLVLLSAAAGPALFDAETVRLPHSGSGPTAGPAHGGSATSPALPVFSPHQLLASSLAQTLLRGADQFTWAAAAVGSRAAAAYELTLRQPVLAIGGYQGTDPAPTLARFQAMVAGGKVHWFLPGGVQGEASRAIEAWVTARFPSRVVEGQTIYDLTVGPEAQRKGRRGGDVDQTGRLGYLTGQASSSRPEGSRATCSWRSGPRRDPRRSR